MNGRRGTVWHGDRRVGALREDENRVLHFAYDGAWLDGGGFPVSIRLPLSLGDEEVDAHAFFAGLLPEGGTRQRICRQRGIALEDDTGLLLAIGEHHEPERITRSDWQTFARELGMPPRRLLDRVGELATALPAVAEAAREAFAQAHGDAQAYDRLEEAVRGRCRWTLESLHER